MAFLVFYNCCNLNIKRGTIKSVNGECSSVTIFYAFKKENTMADNNKKGRQAGDTGRIAGDMGQTGNAGKSATGTNGSGDIGSTTGRSATGAGSTGRGSTGSDTETF